MLGRGQGLAAAPSPWYQVVCGTQLSAQVPPVIGV